MKCAKEAFEFPELLEGHISEERLKMYYAKNQLSQKQTENSTRIFMRTRTLLALKKATYK